LLQLSLQQYLTAEIILSALQNRPNIILGIDPGTLMMGFSLIIANGNRIELIVMDVIKLSSKMDTYKRLNIIYQKVSELVLTYKPTQLAIEAPFYGKNVQSMLKLGRAQGVAIAAAMQVGLPVTEYSPRKVKQSITGNGNSDKIQVMEMLKRLVKFSEDPKHLDATDALAVAICHHFQNGALHTSSPKSAKGWKEFIATNAERIGAKTN
jgi:crossover junction endodeoxyribonuclease RuvC